MQTELTNLPSGDVQIRVCEDNICVTGWVTSHHLVPPKKSSYKKILVALLIAPLLNRRQLYGLSRSLPWREHP